MLDKPFCYRYYRFDLDPCEHPECSALRNEAALWAEDDHAAALSPDDGEGK